MKCFVELEKVNYLIRNWNYNKLKKNVNIKNLVWDIYYRDAILILLLFFLYFINV